MSDYTFLQLSADEFEDFVCDLLSAELALPSPLQRFAAGPDGGVDGLFSTPANRNAIVVQCKRYTHWSDLRKTMTSEASKVRQMDPTPSRYILATSVQLTPHNKDELLRIVGAPLQSLQDVIGQDDLNSLLGRHPQVEGRHYKLYITSANVLNRLLHASCLSHAHHTVEMAQKAAETYVPTPSYHRALQLLTSQAVCVLTGNPGVGKSTLSDVLIACHVKQGYAVAPMFSFADNLPVEPKQLIYFDDFLGVTHLAEEDERLYRKLMRLVSRCHHTAATGNTRFLLTCRTYLFTKASEELEERALKMSQFECRLAEAELEPYAEAILKSHLQHSELPAARKAELWHARRQIVASRCFTPRLVEQLIALDAHADFHEQLSDPSFIWHKAAQRMVMDPAVAALLYVATVNIPEKGVGCPVSVLLTAWTSMLQSAPPTSASACAASSSAVSPVIPSSHVFNTTLRSMEGSLLKRNNEGDNESCMLFYNGSVTDYLTQRITTDSAVLQRLLDTVATGQQILYLASLSNTQLTTVPFSFAQVFRHLLDKAASLLEHWPLVAPIVGQAAINAMLHAADHDIILPKLVEFYKRAELPSLVEHGLECSVTAMELLLDYYDGFAKMPEAPAAQHCELYEKVFQHLVEGADLDDDLAIDLFQRMQGTAWPISPARMTQALLKFDRILEGRIADGGPGTDGQWYGLETDDYRSILELAHAISPKLRVLIHKKWTEHAILLGFDDHLATESEALEDAPSAQEEAGRAGSGRGLHPRSYE